ncbi:seipin-like [Aplochiton taeniatus]
MVIQRARQRLLQGALTLTSLLLLLWTASFLYGSFYYSYMPKATYSTPVHYYYRTDCESSASYLCSFPIANVSLLRHGKKQVMSYGQPYRITLELEMPESPANQEIGMFMVRITCYSREGRHIDSSSRSTMLRYRSGLLRTLGTLLFFPAFLTGASTERQLVEVELFSEYTDNSYNPAIGAIVEIQSNQVQIYSAQLYIYAHFTGLRYILFHFPLMSATVGVTTNFVFLGMVLVVSYLRLHWGPTSTQTQNRQQIAEGASKGAALPSVNESEGKTVSGVSVHDPQKRVATGLF